jgi:apolipoprotein D and lipocalin family protein
MERLMFMGILRDLFGKSTKDIKPVCNVNLERYLGRWYEIARLPHSFEEGLEYVTATYNSKDNGRIEVINAGMKNGEKKSAKGVAWVPDKNCTGRLLVSFFWPFKSEYKIILLDEKDYQYAVVTSSNMNYLWILSRKPEISSELYDYLVGFAASKGFDTDKLIKVTQSSS